MKLAENDGPDSSRPPPKTTDLHQCNRKFERNNNRKKRNSLRMQENSNSMATVVPDDYSSRGRTHRDVDDDDVLLSLLNLKSIPGRLDLMSQVMTLFQIPCLA